MYLICLFWEKLFINLKKIYNQLHWKFFYAIWIHRKLLSCSKIFFHIRYFLIEGEQTKNLLWLMSKNDILSPWSLIIVVRIFNGKINIWNLILMLVLESWIQKNWTFLTWFEIGWSCFGIVTYICKFFAIYTGIYGLIHTK